MTDLQKVFDSCTAVDAASARANAAVISDMEHTANALASRYKGVLRSISRRLAQDPAISDELAACIQYDIRTQFSTLARTHWIRQALIDLYAPNSPRAGGYYTRQTSRYTQSATLDAFARCPEVQQTDQQAQLNAITL